MSDRLNAELDSLKYNEDIADWSVSLGYGCAEYTIDLNRNSPLDIKLLAKKLSKTYGATEIVKCVDGSSVAVKFVIEL